MFLKISGLLPVLLLSVLISVGRAVELKVIGWNMESGDADPALLAEQVGNFQDIDIWGFSEVHNMSWADAFTEAAADGEGGAEFRMIMGASGGGDRLLIVYNSTVLEELGHLELHDLNPGGRVRAPLVGHFRVKNSGQEFFFMVNHLYRSGAEQRHLQSEGLNRWAGRQSLPVIAVGDYNYDWNIDAGDQDHDRGYDLLTAGDVFSWLRPENLIPTQCHSRYKSVLDFIFVNTRAAAWNGVSSIEMAQDNYCPDDSRTSDHRPILARFNLSDSGSSREQIIIRIEKIQQELRELHRLVEELPGS